MNKEEIYKKAFIIRTFEKLLLFLFEKGMIKGTTHTSIGQELIPVLALDNLHERDYVISNHRSHAHFISYANDYEKLLDEILEMLKEFVEEKVEVNIYITKDFILMES